MKNKGGKVKNLLYFSLGMFVMFACLQLYRENYEHPIDKSEYAKKLMQESKNGVLIYVGYNENLDNLAESTSYYGDTKEDYSVNIYKSENRMKKVRSAIFDVLTKGEQN